jgi:hypothetical protein
MSADDDATPSLRLEDLLGEEQAEERRERDAARRAEAEAAAKFELERRRYQERALTDDDRTLFRRRIRTEFLEHAREVMLASFPSDYCEDGGRHINHQLEGWEDQLPGYARRIYDFWNSDLRLGGFGFDARVISFSPEGFPQDIGLFATWPDVQQN